MEKLNVKESIFNLIQGDIAGGVVLDLFAGSGAFGAECVSRGAKKVYFVDHEQKAINTIKLNTKNMSEDFEILHMGFEEALTKFSNADVKFDLVYLDPPYKSDYAINALNLLIELQLLKDNATIVVENGKEREIKLDINDMTGDPYH